MSSLLEDVTATCWLTRCVGILSAVRRGCLALRVVNHRHNVVAQTSPKRNLAVTAAPGALPDYRALVEAAGDIIYTLDFEGRFTFVNSAVARVLGYAPDEVLGARFTEFLTAESAQIALRHFGQGLTDAESTPFFEVEARRKGGGTVHLEIRAGSLLRDEVLVGRQGIARDISELKALQSALSQRAALFEERMRTALGLYARIADLAGESSSDPMSSAHALGQMRDAVKQACADKMGLTASDLRIVELLSSGYSNREIAEAVCLSPHTVKDHVARILQRLGARRRAEAVAAALRLGLISARA